MRILVDADGCPVVDSTIALAKGAQNRMPATVNLH